MKGAHAYFSGAGGIRLHYRCWEVPNPRGAVIVCHGLGEHSGRYDELARDLARAGLSTFALDHRGHGRSDGRRGHVRRFVRFVHDLEKFRRRVVGEVGPETPLLFLGHSLGGLIAIRYLQEYPGVLARGLILSAPLVGIGTDVPRWKERASRLLRFVLPALPLSTGLDPEDLSHDRQIVEAYRRDPLVHDRITPRLYWEIRNEIEVAFEKVSELRSPMLILVPAADNIVRPDLVQHFAASAGGPPRVRVETLPGLYHEPLNEATRSRVVADLLGWVEHRLGVPAASRGEGVERGV